MELRVAAVQMVSHNGAYEENRQRAEYYILKAVDQGARLISLPEFALAGYIYEDSIWNAAEPLRGPTYQWLCRLCRQHDVYIATCIFEREGQDFYDTFILCGPGGQLWAHRKIEPAAYEAFFFKGGGLNPSTFATPIGQIGIAICFDTSKTYTIKSLLQQRPQLLLLQYSYPGLPLFFPKRIRDNWVETYKKAATTYANHLKVPVVTSNKTGSFSTSLPFNFGLKYAADFIDHSFIVGRDGGVMAQISNGQGFICSQVELADPVSGPVQAIPKARWYLPYSWLTRLTTEYARNWGMIRYKFSRKRKKAALKYLPVA